MANTPDRRFGVSRLFVILLLIGLLVGCSRPEPVPTRTLVPVTLTSTPPAVFNTSAAAQWGTLPPEWTQTFTPMPSKTYTASPVPPTATPIPPATMEEVCDSIEILNDFADGAAFSRDESIGFVFGTLLTHVLPPGSDAPVPFMVRFIVQHKQLGDNIGADVPPGEIVGLQLDASELLMNGTYQWAVSIVGEPFGEDCVNTGTFFVED